MTQSTKTTEWSGRHEAKDRLRARIWTRLAEEGLSPNNDPFGHIPAFVGAAAAAERLSQLPIWHRAVVIKANPDTAHVAARLRALQDGKRLYMAVPRLTQERCFIRLTSEELARKGISSAEAATWQGALEYGVPVTLDEMEPIDLVLAGCVAVSRDGGRTGKGAGFADLELGMLSELGLLSSDTPVVALVHAVQVVEANELPLEAHDWALNWIVTPDEVIETGNQDPRPRGLMWDAIRPDQYQSIPVLRQLYDRMNKGID